MTVWVKIVFKVLSDARVLQHLSDASLLHNLHDNLTITQADLVLQHLSDASLLHNPGLNTQKTARSCA